MWVLLRPPRFGGANHASDYDDRLDIAKSVFQVHGIDVEGNALIRRQLKRRDVLTFFQKLQPCLVGIETCATSHYWSRQLKALGHTVRLMPPAYVKPYVKRQKNDATDAEAICEAVTRANMRFVETKTNEQQSCLMPRWGARAWRLSSRSSLMWATIEYPRWHGRVSPPSAPNCGGSSSRSSSSTV
jgi:hypothetical protein